MTIHANNKLISAALVFLGLACAGAGAFSTSARADGYRTDGLPPERGEAVPCERCERFVEPAPLERRTIIERRTVIERPVIVERRIIEERPVVVERPPVIERRVFVERPPVVGRRVILGYPAVVERAPFFIHRAAPRIAVVPGRPDCGC